MGKIFISHSSANNAEALAIHDWLSEQGWGDVFLDLDPKRGLVAGDRWQAALKAAAEQCELILILISPDWAKSKWCLAEFLLAKQMNKQILGVVVRDTPLADLPVELTAEWQLVDLSAPDAGWSTTISPPRYEPETTVKFSGTGLARLRAGLEKAGLDATTFLWPPATDLGRSPYRGLLPLDQDDAGIFFGRDGAIVLTLDALRGLRAAAAPRFATILGASGAGKSSFLRAGILPRLARDSRHFYILPIIRPERAALTGEHGFAAMIEAALKARNVTRNRADIRDAVLKGAEAVAPILHGLAVPADAGDVAGSEPPTLVIAIDQAEELLTADHAEAAPFLTLLAELGRRDDVAILVIFTVRSDSFDQLQSRPELAATQPHHLIDLPPIPAGSFGDIIRGPARRVTAAGRKLTIDETLVDALLADIEIGGTKDALPLLAFTLERLYTDYGADGDLQLTEYERLGRIRGAIEAAVELALTKADSNPAIPRDRSARLALLRRGLIPWLAGIDPNTGSPRRRVARMAEVPQEARPLIELMVEQRLLATDIDGATKEQTIEPAHEALLRQWGALDGWLVEDSADLSTLEALRRAASEWDANARASEFIIHRGARLQTLEQVAAGEKFASYLNSIDRAYLSAARNVENEAVKRARAARTRWGIAAAIAGVVVVAGGTAGYFIWSAGEASRKQAAVNFEIARAEAALRAGKPEEGAMAALGAYELQPDMTTRTMALAASMAIPPNANGVYPIDGRIVDAAFLDLQRVAVLAATGEVTILDTGKRTVTSSAAIPADPLPIALAADGNGGGIVIRNDTSMVGLDGSVVVAPAALQFFPASAKTSMGGKVVVFEGIIGDVLARDCRSLPCVDSVLALPAGSTPTAVAVKPDGSAVAVRTDGHQIALYRDDFSAPAQIMPDTIDEETVDAFADIDFSRDDQLVITGRTTTVVDLKTGKQLTVNKNLESGFAAWSPRGEIMAVGCDRTTICFYGVDGGRRGAFTGHNNAIRAVRWSPDGSALVSFAPSDPVRLWTFDDDPQIVSTRPSNRWLPLTSVAVDREHGHMAAGEEYGTLFLWPKSGAAQSLTIAGLESAVTSVAFLSDGRLVAVHRNEAVSIWTPGKAVPDKVIKLDNLSFSRVAALTGDIRAAVPLSDKTILVLSGDDLREARVAADSMPLDQWGLTAAPGANSAFVSYSDGTIRRRDLGAGGEGAVVFDAGTSACGAAPTKDNNGSKSLDVSADGKWLVATRTDSAVIVHNLVDPSKPLCIALPAPDSKTVAFSPDSTRLAILSATDRLYVFDLAQPDKAVIFGAPAVPDNSPLAVAAGSARTTSWLAWRDNATIVLSTTAGVIESVVLDPASWRARVDSLTFTP